jgi:hypothetical protein
MRATSSGLHALRRREAISRRRNAFVARRDGKRIPAGLNDGSGSVDEALHKPARLLLRSRARGCALLPIRRVIAAPLQRDQDEEDADRAFGEKDQTRLLQKRSTPKRDVAAGLSLRKRPSDSSRSALSAIN